MRRRTPLFCSNFYPRPPRGGRPALRLAAKLLSRFLPTPSTRRATGGGAVQQPGHLEFLPTPSTRRATESKACSEILADISTHALHEEGDDGPNPIVRPKDDFYPRPPRGGRQGNLLTIFRAIKFLPTPSTRRATHTPSTARPGPRNFYPRPPRGGRHA